jgi:putative hemolysin
MHIVEQLIRERAPKLIARPKLWRAIKPLLYRFLAYDAAVFLADGIAQKSGREAFAFITSHIRPRTAVSGLHNLPEIGKAIVISNHPTGLADGMAVFQAICDRRPDHVFLANADALRVMPKARDIIIPVEWREEKRTLAKTKQTLVETKKVLDAGRCVVIFPSGRLGRLGFKGVYDQPWQSSAAMLAKKYDVPVIPLQIKARNSLFYYLVSRLNGEIRDITLFHELLNKKGQTFRLTFGEPIAASELPQNAKEATHKIRQAVELL